MSSTDKAYIFPNCKKISLACTQACVCSGDECLNPFNTAVSSKEDNDEDISSDSEDLEY